MKEFQVKNGIISLGPIVLPVVPSLPEHATSKSYVDARAAVQSVAGKTGDVNLVNSDVGLGNVENKSSATIRGELTQTNVTNALGFIPVRKTGDTMTGALTLSGAPTANLHAASKLYVDTQIEDTRFNPAGSEGQILYLQEDGSNLYGYEDNVKFGAFVSDDTELAAAQQAFQGPQAIYDTWSRISHSNSLTAQPAIPSELTAWAYDSGTDVISCTLNTSSMVGFISPSRYTKYQHTVQLSSTAGDDDMIGVVIAFAKDSLGVEHTLTAIRSVGGYGTSAYWSVYYDFSQSTQVLITNNSVTAGVGSFTAWNQIVNGTTVSVERDNDLITCQCSQFDTSTLDPATTITIDLTSDPLLNIFRGPKPYGYVAKSQLGASFSDITFSEPNNLVFDVRDGAVYEADDQGNYTVSTTRTIFSEYGPNRILFNPSTTKMFYTLLDGVQLLAQNSSGGGSVPLATTTTPGVVQVGSGLNISGGVLSTANNGTITSVANAAGSGMLLVPATVNSGPVTIKNIGNGASSGLMFAQTATDISIVQDHPSVNFSTAFDLNSANVKNAYYRYTGAGAVSLTAPTASYSNGLRSYEYHFRQAGDGQITFVPAAGVTINAPFGGTLVTAGKGASVTLKLVGPNEYDLIGQVVPA